jgi:hypothetical protein
MTLGAVTGRQYIKTRVRGYASWNPKPETLDVIKRVKDIIAEYLRALTIRQIFYRLVGKYSYEKTERAYEKLGEYLNRARRAGLLGWETIRDDGDIVPAIPGWESPNQFWNTVRDWAEDYFKTPDGDHYVEIWVEAAGMTPQIQDVADPFGVRAIHSGGFSSSTARRNAALRLIEIAKKKSVLILLIGDYDPSGQSIMDSAVEDVIAFADGHRALTDDFELVEGLSADNFERLAVTPEQAEEYDLESAPQKETDKRGEYMAETYQAEALDPDVLAEIVRAKLLELIGDENITDAEEQTERERGKILANIETIRGGKE